MEFSLTLLKDNNMDAKMALVNVEQNIIIICDSDFDTQLFPKQDP